MKMIQVVRGLFRWIFGTREGRLYAWGFLALSILFGLPIGWGLPNTLSVAMDSIAPYSPLIWIGDYSNPNVAKVYPDFHVLVLLPFYAVTLLIEKLIGNWQSVSSVFPFGFRDPAQGLGALIYVSRLIVIVFGAVAALLILRFRHHSIPFSANLAALVIIALNGVYSYYSGVANLDIPYLFWFVLAALFTWRYLFVEPFSQRSLVFAGLFSAFSIATKDPAAGYVFGLGALILFVGPEKDRSIRRNLRAALLFTGIAVAAYVVVAILPQPFRWVAHVHEITSSDVRDSYKIVSPTLSGHLSLLWKTIRMLANNLTWPGLLLAFAGLIDLAASRRWRLLAFIILPGLMNYVFVIMNVLYTYERFVLLDSFLLSLPIGLILVRLYQLFRTKVPRLVPLFYVIVGLLLVYHGVRGYWTTTYPRLFPQHSELASSIADYVPPGSALRWQAAGGYFRLPTSDVFLNYRFIRPPGLDADITKTNHVYSAYDSTYLHVLSARPLDETSFGGLRLLRAYRQPEWMVKQWEHMSIFQEFYLYERTTPKPMSLSEEPYVPWINNIPTQDDIRATLERDGIYQQRSSQLD